MQLVWKALDTHRLAQSAGNLDIVWFSRGRGRGHAVRDIAIARELRTQLDTVQILFASYGTGLATLRAAGEEVVDLELPEANPFPETVVRAGVLLSHRRPRLVISQEELAALSAAKIFGLATLLETHWFPLPRHSHFYALMHADEILFMEEEGIFEEPHPVEGKVHYFGPVLRRFEPNPHSREAIRAHLSVGPCDLLVLVLPGSFPEAKSPILHLVTDAFRLIESFPSKLLLWSAGADFHDVLAQCACTADMTIVESYTNVDEMLIASDVVITKGTYNIGREAMALGTRSISLSHCNNHVDDVYSQSFATNKWFDIRSISPRQLAQEIEESARMQRPLPHQGLLHCNGAQLVASHIASILTK